MNELEREFISQSKIDLQRISKRIRENQTVILHENFLNETFRTLHTIKGTAQTFGFSVAGKLAHSLENLISAAKNNTIFFADFNSFLDEGIQLLIKSFEQTDLTIPPLFAAELDHFQSKIQTENSTENLLEEIPETISNQLSTEEKSNLASALKQGNNLSVLEIGFNLKNFAAEFKNFRENLSEKGEIIATLPCSKFSSAGNIGFQIVFTSKETIKSFAEDNLAEVVFEYGQEFAGSLQSVLAKIVGHGKNTAKMLGKDVKFVVLADDFEPETKTLKLIFDLLLHLIRNAVSHAISEKGRVEIDLKKDEKGFTVSVSDNGKGLDKEKIKAVAIEKNLSLSIADFSDQEVLELIFLPEFSTAETLTEISGRGIGLDVVKNLIENAKGKIIVKTEKDQGTTFEIFLPNNF